MAAATTARPARVAAQRGFTLLEVMLGLALLGLGLTVLIKSAASDIFSAQQAHMLGIVTDLARGKMYDIEEKLLHDGFSDTEQHEDDQSFSDEGWPAIHYSYKVEVVELPGFEQLQAIIAGTGSGAAAAGPGKGSNQELTNGGLGSGEEATGGFENSMLGGMLSQFGGLGGGGGGKGSADINASVGGAFIQSQYTMFQQVLKVTIRKVTLTLNYQVMGSDRDLKVVQFLTDAAAMDKVLNGLGAQELPPAGGGSGSGSGGPGGGVPGGSVPGGGGGGKGSGSGR
jgi:prepilin-type N-terminal cleavage/methylation domain-containing protein